MTNSFSNSLFENGLFHPSFLKDSFSGDGICGWQFCSFSAGKMMCYLLLASMVFRWKILCHSNWCSSVDNASFFSICFPDFPVPLVCGSLIRTFLTMGLLGFVPFGICSASCVCSTVCVLCQFGGVFSDYFFESSFSFLLSS